MAISTDITIIANALSTELPAIRALLDAAQAPQEPGGGGAGFEAVDALTSNGNLNDIIFYRPHMAWYVSTGNFWLGTTLMQADFSRLNAIGGALFTNDLFANIYNGPFWADRFRVYMHNGGVNDAENYYTFSLQENNNVLQQFESQPMNNDNVTRYEIQWDGWISPTWGDLRIVNDNIIGEPGAIYLSASIWYRRMLFW